MRVFEDGLVSVIIPAYNAERYMEETVQSALKQSYSRIEIIIVDDCSSDRTGQIISELMKKDERIKYYRFDTNQGAAVARNKALELAKGRFTAFLDSDDIWYLHKTKKQLNLMKEKKAAICFTAIEMIDEKNRMIKEKRKIKKEVDYQFLLKNTMIATSSTVIDRNIVGDFRMPLIRSGQDYATWLMLMRNGEKAYGLDEALVKYRKGSTSLSSKKMSNFKKVWMIQHEREGINGIRAGINCLFYILNAVKKYYM